jgi:CheY-like chemotaxis protein
MSATTTVLHVDDDPALLDLSSSVLANDGRFEAITATSAADGLDRLAEHQIDCVVSDSVQFPDGNAFVTVVGREYPEVPVVLFTAKEPAAVADELGGESVNEYVRKAGRNDFTLLLTHLSRVVDDSPTPDLIGSPDSAVDTNAGSETASDVDTGTAADETDTASARVPDLGPKWRVVGLHDWDDSEELTASVVAAIAGLTDTDVEDLPPLYPAVDPEAVAGVVCPRSDGTFRHGVRVRFPYVGYDCVVTGGGAVAVREASGDE